MNTEHETEEEVAAPTMVREVVTSHTVTVGDQTITLRKPSMEACLLIRLGHAETNALLLMMACLAECWSIGEGAPLLELADPFNVRAKGQAMLRALMKRGYDLVAVRTLGNTAYALVYEAPIARPAKVTDKANFSEGQGDHSNSD